MYSQSPLISDRGIFLSIGLLMKVEKDDIFSYRRNYVLKVKNCVVIALSVGVKTILQTQVDSEINLEGSLKVKNRTSFGFPMDIVARGK